MTQGQRKVHSQWLNNHHLRALLALITFTKEGDNNTRASSVFLHVHQHAEFTPNKSYVKLIWISRIYARWAINNPPPFLYSPKASSAPFPSTFPSIILRFPTDSCALEKAFSSMTVPVVKAAYAHKKKNNCDTHRSICPPRVDSLWGVR